MFQRAPAPVQDQASSSFASSPGAPVQNRSTSEQEQLDPQAQIERATRLGHNFGRVSVSPPAPDSATTNPTQTRAEGMGASDRWMTPPASGKAPLQAFPAAQAIQRVKVRESTKKKTAAANKRQRYPFLHRRNRRKPQAYDPDPTKPHFQTFTLNGRQVRGFHPGGNFRARVSIAYSGNRPGDFLRANRAAGLRQTPRGYVWHHFHNYNHNTNRGTMYLVQRQLHDMQFSGHTGGVAQYKHHFGGYR